MIARPRVALAMRDAELRNSLFSDRLRRRLHAIAECDFDALVTDFAATPVDLAAVDVLLTSWGCPRIDADALARMPRLELIAHAAGTVKAHVDPICWDRPVTVTTAAAANAVPVVEFALAQILLAGKAVLTATQLYREHRRRLGHDELPPVGNYERIVGIIGASTIGRAVIERLRNFDLDVVVYDPTIAAEDAAALGATLVGLDELMGVSDVVSLHAPLLPSTVGMIGAEQLAGLRDGATFINTARGRLVDHAGLRRELVSGRISALLDVTDPEPLEPDDPLYDLPNVQLTPHIAGSMGTELHRMTSLALDEIELFTADAPSRYGVRREDLARMA